jgi:hypothetical protein
MDEVVVKPTDVIVELGVDRLISLKSDLTKPLILILIMRSLNFKSYLLNHWSWQ